MAGDAVYGSADWNKRLLRSDRVVRPLLHAYKTSFLHPYSDSEVVVTAPLPPDIVAILNRVSTAGITPSGTAVGDPSGLIDPVTRKLVVSTDVKGKEPWEQNVGLISLDRLRMDEVR